MSPVPQVLLSLEITTFLNFEFLQITFRFSDSHKTEFHELDYILKFGLEFLDQNRRYFKKSLENFHKLVC